MVQKHVVLWTIGVVAYLVVLISEPLCSNMVRDAKVTSSILVWSMVFFYGTVSFFYDSCALAIY